MYPVFLNLCLSKKKTEPSESNEKNHLFLEFGTKIKYLTFILFYWKRETMRKNNIRNLVNMMDFE